MAATFIRYTVSDLRFAIVLFVSPLREKTSLQNWSFSAAYKIWNIWILSHRTCSGEGACVYEEGSQLTSR